MSTERDAPRCETCKGDKVVYTPAVMPSPIPCPDCAARSPVEGLRDAALEAAQLADDLAAHIDDLGGSGGDTVRTIAAVLYDALARCDTLVAKEKRDRG